MPLTQDKLNIDILNIKVLHSRLGDDYAKSLAYHTGNRWYLKFLFKKCFLIGVYIEILENYNADGSDDVENILSNADIEAIIDDCYRQMNEYQDR